jgi:hypothetical protein
VSNSLVTPCMVSLGQLFIHCFRELNTTVGETKTRRRNLVETTLFGWKSGALTIRLEYRL